MSNKRTASSKGSGSTATTCSLFGEGEHGEAEQPSAHDDESDGGQVGSGGTTSATAKTDVAGGDANTGYVVGTGNVPLGKIVMYYERCKLKKNAPLDELSAEDLRCIEARKEAVWGRAWLADGTKRYEIDGQWRKTIVIPAALKNTGPGDFAMGGDGIFFGIGSVNYRVSRTKDGREEYEPLTFATPWADLS